jgi:polyisoprenyl-teichoic acid--peptidoglycan teichoic acid transferase
MAGPWRRRGTMRRYVIGCVAIIVLTAAATVTAAFGVVSTIAADIALGGKPLDTSYLTPAQAGAPENFLVIGDDHIGPNSTYANGAEQTVNGAHLFHADTFMLVRMDPNQGQTSIMSIPRDLWVNFTWKGQQFACKFNCTYSEGWATGGENGAVDLVKKVVKQLMPGLVINHTMDFNFDAFYTLIQAIGCVYIDVDTRYLNETNDTYQKINLQPGYQRLCGVPALSYVRYRHTDSDFVRVARQQDFIRQAKEQLGVWGFVTRWNELARAFGKAVATDIRGNTEVANLLRLAAFSQSKPLRDVHFKVSNYAYQVDNQEAVQATAQDIKANLDRFLYIKPPVPKVEVANTGASKSAASAHHTRHHHHHHARTAAPRSRASRLASIDLYSLASGTETEALRLSPKVPFSVVLPTVQTGPASLADVHAYRVGDEHHHLRYGYRVDWQVGLGNYYGIEGMNWMNPPLFKNPSAVRKIGKRTYMFVNDGPHIHDIGWRVHGVLYWLSNTLQESLTNAQMLNIAESARRIGG